MMQRAMHIHPTSSEFIPAIWLILRCCNDREGIRPHYPAK
jgi:hypothetical protein